MILQVIPGHAGPVRPGGVVFCHFPHGPAQRHAARADGGPGHAVLCGLPAHGRWAACFLPLAQGRVAAASINLLAKKPDDWSKGMVLCITVEFYAILSLLASMLMIINISA